MQLTGEQLAAILKAGHAMVNADGVVKNEEVIILFHELQNFGVSLEQAKQLMAVADTMNASAMIQILSDLSINEKKYVAGYLASIMAVDGDIDDSEVKLWQLISALCKFPTMTIKEAIEYWGKH